MPTPRPQKAVIISADMAEDMQQDALACAVRAMDQFDLDTVGRKYHNRLDL